MTLNFLNELRFRFHRNYLILLNTYLVFLFSFFYRCGECHKLLTNAIESLFRFHLYLFTLCGIWRHMKKSAILSILVFGLLFTEFSWANPKIDSQTIPTKAWKSIWTAFYTHLDTTAPEVEYSVE